jgi:EAL domain-containing protein (putative c-di-GMP-specific phosphodiesterase class I)
MFAFQPVVCAATGIVDYFECLLRMRDEKGSIIPAGEFITVIEELGLIGRIDRYVLEARSRSWERTPTLGLASISPG